MAAGLAAALGISCGKDDNGPTGPGPVTPIDSIAPIVNSLVIPKYTKTRDIEAIISADSADSMKFFGDIANTGFKRYNTSDSLTLIQGEGIKNVYFVVKDRAGNLSDTLHETTTLDITPPSVPAGLRDTTLYDSLLNLNIPTNGLLTEYFRMWGATSDSGSASSLNSYTLNEGITNLMIFLEDSAGNILRDTARFDITKLDSAEILDRVLGFYADSGYAPSDSGRQFSASDSLFRTYSKRFNYSFRLNNSLFHHIRAHDGSIPDSVKAAFDYTNTFRYQDRFFFYGPMFLTAFYEKLKNDFSNNRR